MPTNDDTQAVERVLAEHQLQECGHFAKDIRQWWSQCEGCDWASPRYGERPTDIAADHRAHVAAILAAQVTKARAEAWDEACEHDIAACRDRCETNPYRAAAGGVR